MPDLGRVGQIKVRAAARADLHVELYDVVARRAAAFRFVLVGAKEDYGDEAEQRQHRADQQPEPEGAALASSNYSGRETEGEGDDEVGHGSIVSSRRLGCPIEPSSERSRRKGRLAVQSMTERA